VDDWRPLAARNNAAWCDLVCRSHGAPTVLDDRAWTTPTRPPHLYPDAVALSPDVTGPELLDRVDASPGCSIKDSFAALDLATAGFRLLFEAQWITCDAAAAPHRAPSPWAVVSGPAGLAGWVEAWRGDDLAPAPLDAELLGHPAVTVLAARRGGRIEAGALLNHTEGAVGLSNVFAPTGHLEAAWLGCLACAAALVPGARLMGYESGDHLTAARAAGFSTTGPLRVWIRD
jgi:hypothetical protein